MIAIGKQHVSAKSKGSDDWMQHKEKGHDDWHKASYPLEEWTSGLELGPDGEVWGDTFTVNYKTSRREFSQTVGPVFITMMVKGSDLMLLAKGAQNFLPGTTASTNLKLSRDIGTLEKVKLQTNSSDGWLLASMWIDCGPSTYYLETTKYFLDYPDSSLADRIWDWGAEGTSFRADPVGTVSEIFEPQAPTRATPGVPGVQLHYMGLDDHKSEIGIAERATPGVPGVQPHYMGLDDHKSEIGIAESDIEGLLGTESVVLGVIDRIATFRDPGTFDESY
eukprot:CAMPEP_0171805010 /NCGR_PEP_ID=MMETSP0991-20121206/74442_1 /TAXON_ID=483369 /ORGANISM="non described non described, Strain CCMP2098" /LENGTH=277 /DNA_ID=CAMNT_0012417473 /DNA_START=135 /DNA_END=970 /DNA_ORIENTATION=-